MPWLSFRSLGRMDTHITNRHHSFYGILFFIFETLFVASVIIFTQIDFHERLAWSDAAGITFWFSFFGLFVISFLLRRTSRYLTIIGWVTLFAGFWFVALLPAA
jgi:hypothetical protein